MESGKANAAAQPEHNGWDVLGDEVLTGDEIIICNITGQMILKQNLERFLVEFHNFHSTTAQ